MPRPQLSEQSPAAEPITGPSADDIDHFRATLREVVDHGVEITRSIAAQAKADPVPHPFWGSKVPVPYPTEHLSTCYDRTARSIRRSIALALTLHHLPGRTPGLPAANPPAANDQRPRAVTPPKATEGQSREPTATSDACEPQDRPDWHEPDEPDESELFAADAARPVDDVIAEIRLDYAALGHPILSPIPPPPARPPAPLPVTERSEPGEAPTAGTARTPAHASKKPHPPPK